MMYGDPATRTVENAVYLPHLPGASWGLFDSSLRVVEESIDYRGSHKELRGQNIEYPADIRLEDGEDAPHLYCGNMHAHFGHFLINTLSRLWNDKIQDSTYRLLFHGNVAHALSQPFVKSIFAALDVDTSRIRSFDRPTRFKSVLVPSTSLHEQYFGYSLYGDVCRSIGDRLMRPFNIASKSDLPVYFSKTRLKSGVGHFVGEQTIESAAQGAGFRIVYPEELSFFEQIEIMRTHSVFVGCTGSVFHNEIFVHGGVKSLILNNIPDINSNFAILDKISNSSAQYFYPEGLTYEYNKNGFLTESKAPHMDRIAEELVGLAKARVAK